MPSQKNDYVYLLQRERECREKAANANDPRVGRVHLEFANRYGLAARELVERTRSAA